MSVMLPLQPDSEQLSPAVLSPSRVLTPGAMRSWLSWQTLDDALIAARAQAEAAMMAELMQQREQLLAEWRAEAMASVAVEQARCAALAAAERIEAQRAAQEVGCRMAAQAAEAIRIVVGDMLPGAFEARLAESLIQHAGPQPQAVMMVNPSALEGARQQVSERLGLAADGLRWVGEPGVAAGRVLMRLHDELLELNFEEWLERLVDQLAPSEEIPGNASEAALGSTEWVDTLAVGPESEDDLSKAPTDDDLDVDGCIDAHTGLHDNLDEATEFSGDVGEEFIDTTSTDPDLVVDDHSVQWAEDISARLL